LDGASRKQLPGPSAIAEETYIPLVVARRMLAEVKKREMGRKATGTEVSLF
jgi:hypothetical protein